MPWPVTGFHLSERDNVLWIETRDGIAADGAPTELATSLVDICRDIDERDAPLAALALFPRGPSFLIDPPGSGEECDAAVDTWRAAVEAVARLSVPTVAIIRGDAIGLAWELALACDLRVASADARLGSPEIRWGRIPSAGGTQRLARAVGSTTATRLLLLGEIVAASEAHALGMVHRIAPPVELASAGQALVAEIAAGAPVALAYTKEAVKLGTDLPLGGGLRLEADLASLLQTTGDRAEGIRSFRERRPPRYVGR